MNWLTKVAKNEFCTDDVLKDRWRDLVSDEQDRADIHFDLENNEPVNKSLRRFEFPYPGESSLHERQVYFVQLMSAGGDWEMPVYYFKIQVKEGWRDKHMFVFIPSREQGNGNLMQCKKGLCPQDSNSSGKDARDEAKAWKALESHLKDWAGKDLSEYR